MSDIEHGETFFPTIDGYVLRSKVISGLYRGGFRKAADYCKGLAIVEPPMKWKSIKDEIPGKFGAYLFYKKEWGAMWFVHLAADGYAHLHNYIMVPIGEFINEMDYWMYVEEPKEANDE